MRWARIVCLAGLVGAGCKDEAPVERGPEPMRNPPSRSSPPPDDARGGPSGAPEAPAPAADPSGRPAADPEIERALALIADSGLRFVDQASDPDAAGSEYTAEQFASMLRTKWDWLGYDLTELEPWLDAIATRSFKTNLPYQVVLADGETRALRSWLDAELAASAPDR